MVDWQNRILSYGVKPADQFLAHPKNARLHPQIQREAVKASLDTLGWIAPVIESKSGYLVDGHERLWQALQDNAPVPYIVVDLTPEEEDTALLIFDPITGLANYDAQKLDALLRDVNTDAPALQQMLSTLAAQNGLVTPDNPYDEWVGMPEFEQEGDKPFHSLILHFQSEQDMKDFAKLVEQTVNTTTKYLYYPKLIHDKESNFVVVGDES